MANPPRRSCGEHREETEFHRPRMKEETIEG